MPMKIRHWVNIKNNSMIQLVYDGNNISWDTDRSNFTFEASEVRSFQPDNKIKLFNPKTGNVITFEKVKVDTDNEGEIQGWRYEAVHGHTKPCTLLAIND